MPTPGTPDWDAAFTFLQEVEPPSIAPGSRAMTLSITYQPGDSGAPPHRHSGPVFGYVAEGEMRFELEGEPERVIRAGEAFWEPGGDVIHYQDANNRDDGVLRFIVTMLCAPDVPMLTFVDVNRPELGEGSFGQKTGETA